MRYFQREVVAFALVAQTSGRNKYPAHIANRSDSIPILSTNCYQQITYEAFARAVAAADCTAISVRYFRPLKGELARTFRCRVRPLLLGETYAAGGVDRTRAIFLDHTNAAAHPIRFEDVVGSPDLVKKLITDRAQLADIPLTEARLITIHCSGCDRRIVVDGTHRLARLAYEGRHDAELIVIELSGASWPRQTPDLDLVCVCVRDS